MPPKMPGRYWKLSPSGPRPRPTNSWFRKRARDRRALAVSSAAGWSTHRLLRMRYRVEYALAWLVIKTLGWLPRPLARAAGIAIGQLVYVLHVKLRRVGMRNLALAFPEKSHHERAKIL